MNRIGRSRFLTEAMIEMNMKRWLLLLPVALLCPAWAVADPMNPDLQVITDGFASDQEFDAAANPGTPPPDLPNCIGSDCDEFVFDPLIRLQAGGGSPIVGLTFSFVGDGTFDFKNESGVTFSSLEITFSMSKDAYNAILASGAVFSCDPGDVFATCGIQAVDPPGTETLNYFYSGGPGIPSIVPEPSQWMFLSLALAGIVIARRKFRFNSAYSRN
jgi:hypothetical protein